MAFRQNKTSSDDLITSDDVRHVKLKMSGIFKQGYDFEEVDNLLDRVVAALEFYEESNKNNGSVHFASDDVKATTGRKAVSSQSSGQINPFFT